ncbi:flavin-containing monooxygenase [Rhodococcus rhodochrous]|uniref:flavin-containing monooxygenase n=1 Tax=Rhodococcus rhodochrous TaxID=1829 RepID=UPI00188B9BF1|nr:NAD(P)/FAD-dependent oxidoreductase [Rhodococcus rhodochrous]MBF4476658.1 NAD(P)/FAD-dependent oxidoreductase [Rhodococcus rhodochrous]
MIVVGAGMGGIYAVHRFVSQGLSVLGLEGAPDVGGVWYHNAYPGARVDIESANYCYFFDPELYREWKWSERYAAQPEILAYLNHVADRYDVRRHIKFNTYMVSGQWENEANRYSVTTEAGEVFTARYLVMTTGQLSKPRRPQFAGLDDFQGEWYQTSQWPHEPVELDGKRIGVIGTGSSGVQVITAVAPIAKHLTVFQRTPNYSVPAYNRAADTRKHKRLAADVEGVWKEILESPGGLILPPGRGHSGQYTYEQIQQMLEERWAFGGQSLLSLFSDQGVDPQVNEIVAQFVRERVMDTVEDPKTAETLVPDEYPIGVRRLCIDTGYYETFNRPNVSLVDLKADPIERITPQGIRLAGGEEIELDVIVFALGFNAFTGALDEAGIRNEHGVSPSDNWSRGPRTFLGLTTTGFPNLFLVTGPGSPSVLANMNVANVQHINFIGDLIDYMTNHGYQRVEPTIEAETDWTEHAASIAEPMLRRKHDNYMVHVNRDDDSRVFIPYAGGFNDYVARVQEVVDDNYAGFIFK